jgi:hypothetical protein
MAMHVGDVLFTPLAPKVHAEFFRLVRAKFNITGGEEPVSKLCGCQFRFDVHAEAATMQQEDFARAVLAKSTVRQT